MLPKTTLMRLMVRTTQAHMRATRGRHIRHIRSYSSAAAAAAATGGDVEDKVVRASPSAIKGEVDVCYELVQRQGRGFVYLGSSRAAPSSSHYQLTRDLARQIHTLYPSSTCWSGAGPGLMEACTLGARDAGARVAGLKIYWGEALEDDDAVSKTTHPYLTHEEHAVLYFFSARKHGLVDAGVRAQETDRTAFIALPGGVGTLDELLEVLVLRQLKRVDAPRGTEHPLPPALVMNYDGVYDGLLQFLQEDARRFGYVSEGELDEHLLVCATNEEAVNAIKAFYA
ncbi:cytokinin riboside 5'-monophosphate phosphoribohydrolase [Pseudoscourfieldia marina]